MKGRGNTKIVEHDLRGLAQGDVTADTFRLTLRHQLLQQAGRSASEAEGGVGHPGTMAVRPGRPRAGFHSWSPPRWGVAFTTVVLLMVLAGTGYATEPIINQLFGRSPDTNQPLGTAFDLSQTANGYTMTLQRAYADRRFIIVGYTITGEGGRAVNGVQPVEDARALTDPSVSTFPILIDDQGREMSWLGGSGYSSTQTNTMINTYSGADIPAGASQVTLHLEAKAMEVPRQDHSMAVVSGRWAFTFTIPVAPSRIAEPWQTVVDRNGWAVTLGKVAITPTQVSVTLRGAGTEAHVELIAGDQHYVLPAPGGYGGGDAATGRAMKECFAESRQCPQLWKGVNAAYGASADVQDGHIGDAIGWAKELENQRGAWKLIVTAPPQPGKLFQPQGGPWIFHFTMPE